MPRSRFRSELDRCRRPRSVADLTASGTSRDVLRGPRWRRTSRGYYVPADTPDGQALPTQRILEVVPLVGAVGAISGWAAAFVAGVDTLEGRDPWTMAHLPVDVVLRRDLGRMSTSRVLYHREWLPSNHVQVCAGVPVTSPSRAALDGARWAADLAEAVAFADACAHHTAIDPLLWRDFVGRHRARGIKQARRAADLVDRCARNGWESRLRVFVVEEARLPRPLVNVPVFDLDGRLLGMPDLLIEDAALVLEFDGADHRSRGRHREDNVREERFEGAGLIVVRADSLDLRHHRTQLRSRVRTGYERGLARDRNRDGWTATAPPWWEEHAGPEELLSDEEKHALFSEG